MTVPTEAERFIRFQLEQLTVRNEHHMFEEISYRIAERRLSSNILLATGPVSAGGDQGRDAESYYTSLPEELPGTGGFVGRATTKKLVVAASVQKTKLEAKVRTDLLSICGQGTAVSRVAFFAVQDIDVATRHRLQTHAKDVYDVDLEVFDGQAVMRILAQRDLIWVAQQYLGLPSHLVPDDPDNPQPDWYTHTLAAVRSREVKWLTAGAFSEVRDALRHASFDDDARVDLPEWLRYTREFIDNSNDAELVARARYESVVATLRGLNTLRGTEDDIRAVLGHAAATNSPAALEDASVLLMYWGSSWLRHIANATPEELREWNLTLRSHVCDLLVTTEESTHPIRKAHLLSVLAHLCLHPRWPEDERPPAGTLPTAQETTVLALELQESGESFVLNSRNAPVDVQEAMDHLSGLVELLPRARAFPVETVSTMFQIITPVLIDDPRYAAVREGLDDAEAAVAGDSVIADRCRARAVALRRAGRPLDALREFHNAKIKWWHGGTLRGSLLAMRFIGQLYAELRMPYAAKQYALAAAGIASASTDVTLRETVPDALIDAMDHAYIAGAWGDALGLANLAILAHGALSEDAFDLEVHPGLRQIDQVALTVLLTAEKFRPALSPTLRTLVDKTYGDLDNALDEVRPSFGFTEEGLAMSADEQLVGRPFCDLGPRRKLGFAALGTTWRVDCSNVRQSVLAAERFTAAAQILLVELAPTDPLFLYQDVHVEVIVGTALTGRAPVRFVADNGSVTCRVILRPATTPGSADDVNRELATALVYLLTHLTARPQHEFMATVLSAFKAGLLHKLYSSQPYDEIAGILDEPHYNALAALTAEPLKGAAFRPNTAEVLRQPTSPGPGYDHATALTMIRQSYEDLPALVGSTLPRALADATTVSGLRVLRDEGWLDWHLLVAIVNAAWNVRALESGLLDNPDEATEQLKQLALQPEDEHSSLIPLTALAPEHLRAAMETAIPAIARRRWKLRSTLPILNSSALLEMLKSRYNFMADDVPHRDLLSNALASDGTLFPLIAK